MTRLEQVRRSIIIRLANQDLAMMSDSEILKQTPKDYGDAVTDDHLNFVFDKTCDLYDTLSDAQIFAMKGADYEQAN